MTTTNSATSAHPAIAVTGYAHVAVLVDDVDAALAFYCDVLGFEQLPRPDLGPGAWLRLGTADIHLLLTREMPPSGRPHIALHVPPEQFDDTMSELAARGVALQRGPSSRVDFGTTVRAAVIADPAGNPIELTDAATA